MDWNGRYLGGVHLSRDPVSYHCDGMHALSTHKLGFCRAKLVDFDLRKEEHVRAQPVIEWIKDYFSPPSSPTSGRSLNEALMGASPVSITDKMPLILQHKGHSITVAGYEQTKNGTVNLLVFDPSKRIDPTLRKAGLATHASIGSPKGQKRSGSPSSGINKFFKKHRTDENSQPGEDDEIVIIDESKKSKPLQKKASPTSPTSPSKNSKDFPDDLGDPLKFVQSFREDPKKLGRKAQYQILWFPMTEPYTEKERLSRKVVTSTKGC